MATGTIPASFPSLKSRDSRLSFAMSEDFAKVAHVPNSQRRRSQRVVIKNSNSGSDTVELQPASEGSPLLVPRQKYCESVRRTVRRKSRTVMAGNVALGSEHPIRIQTDDNV